MARLFGEPMVIGRWRNNLLPRDEQWSGTKGDVELRLLDPVALEQRHILFGHRLPVDAIAARLGPVAMPARGVVQRDLHLGSALRLGLRDQAKRIPGAAIDRGRVFGREGDRQLALAHRFAARGSAHGKAGVEPGPAVFASGLCRRGRGFWKRLRRGGRQVDCHCHRGTKRKGAAGMPTIDHAAPFSHRHLRTSCVPRNKRRGACHYARRRNSHSFRRRSAAACSGCC